MHFEVLNKKSIELFPFFNNFKGFYLAGGTGLALQIGHRISVDFDFFTPKGISKKLLNQCEQVFHNHKISSSINNSDELTIFVNDIKTTFLRYHYPIMTKTLNCKGVAIFSTKEIAVTKAYTIGRRGSFKDYVDLYFSIKEGYTTLSEIIDLADKKYGNSFNSRLFLEQLLYLEDIDDDTILFLKEPINKKIIEKFFVLEIKKIKL